MINFIHKLEKEFDTKFVNTRECNYGENTFYTDSNGIIKGIALYELNLGSLNAILPIADGLNELVIADCGIEKLESIESFSELKKLELILNPIKNNSLYNIDSLTKLKKLHIECAEIDDTTPLGGIESLVELNLGGCEELVSVRGLEGLSSLKRLDLHSTYVESINNINVSSSLLFLGLRNTVIQRISHLERFPLLKELEITGQSISKIEGLQMIKSLERLNLSTTSISKIEGLSELNKLKILDLHRGEIDQIEGLMGLEELKQLNLSQNRIRKVEKLESLKNLENLLLDFNEIKEIDLDSLSKFNSHCHISLVRNPINKFDIDVPDNVSIQFEDDNWIPKGL